nr:hypothetical protein SHINE37_42379 [Rhizobiaceae bacterium]
MGIPVNCEPADPSKSLSLWNTASVCIGHQLKDHDGPDPLSSSFNSNVSWRVRSPTWFRYLSKCGNSDWVGGHP